jgi:hypothetical protein
MRIRILNTDRQYQNGKKILEKMGRDNRFYTFSAQEKEEEMLASQVSGTLIISQR